MDEFVKPGRRSPFKTGKLDSLLVKNTASGLVPQPVLAGGGDMGEQDEEPAPADTTTSKADIGDVFKTPDEAAEEDAKKAPEEPKKPDSDDDKDDKTGKGGKVIPPKNGSKWYKPGWPPTKKQWIIYASALAVLLILTGVTSWYLVSHKAPKKAPVVTVQKQAPPPPAPEPILSTFTGLPITDAAINKKQVTAIQIENSPDARPQSGLLEAGIVWEAIAEGGITRFNAMYQDTAVNYIGPVRSIRPYYVDWLLPFDAALAHAGGSPQGLSDVQSLHVKDLDLLGNSGSSMRITSRYAPHNLYSGIDKLGSLELAKGFNSSTYVGFTRKKEEPLKVPTAKTVDLAISSFYYNVHYDYDAAKNAYLRSEGGQPHKDDKTGTQLEPKVVVAIVMGRGIDADGQHTDYQTVGSGQMYVFQDGGVTQGTWSKSSRQAQWTFTDANGKALAFNPGQTWFTMMDTPGLVTYKP